MSGESAASLIGGGGSPGLVTAAAVTWPDHTPRRGRSRPGRGSRLFSRLASVRRTWRSGDVDRLLLRRLTHIRRAGAGASLQILIIDHRVVKPPTVARAVLVLAADRSRRITRQTLTPATTSSVVTIDTTFRTTRE